MKIPLERKEKKEKKRENKYRYTKRDRDLEHGGVHGSTIIVPLNCLKPLCRILLLLPNYMILFD
jgi:hypothetical protein